jgi:hypothetical protein
MGQTPEEAYFVKCDAETNPLATREAGCVVIESVWPQSFRPSLWLFELRKGRESRQ